MTTLNTTEKSKLTRLLSREDIPPRAEDETLSFNSLFHGIHPPELISRIKRLALAYKNSPKNVGEYNPAGLTENEVQDLETRAHLVYFAGAIKGTFLDVISSEGNIRSSLSVSDASMESGIDSLLHLPPVVSMEDFL